MRLTICAAVLAALPGLWACDPSTPVLDDSLLAADSASVDADEEASSTDIVSSYDVTTQKEVVEALSGQFGYPCTSNAECNNGFCIDGLNNFKICTQNCLDSCPDKFKCESTPGSDAAFICVVACKPEICDGKDNDCNGIADDGMCEDGNPCTHDECNLNQVPASCKHVELNGTSCQDGSECTENDKCINGTCTGSTTKVCTDKNVCTKDNVCDPAIGCVFPPQVAPCEDGDKCTVSDQCKEGSCAPGAPAVCTDNNPCTDNKCAPATGCFYKAVPDQPNSGCPKDGDPKTVEWCVNGKCGYK